MSHVSIKKAIDLLKTIINENLIICSGMTETDIVQFVQLIVKEGYNPQFLQLLNVIYYYFST